MNIEPITGQTTLDAWSNSETGRPTARNVVNAARIPARRFHEIGSRVTPIIANAKVDEAFLIPDEEAVPVIYDLLEHEGLCLGGSTGINVAGAIRLANQLGPGHTIVTILCDSGNRYQSKLFNPDFMRSKNLPVPQWLEKRTTVKIPLAPA